MKVEMTPTNRLVLAIVVAVAIGVAFWMLLLSPKREEASKLQTQVTDLKASLTAHEAEVTEAEAAKKEFPVQYERLVVLGKAVPGDDDTASLLIQLNRIAEDAEVKFSTLKLSSTGGEAPPAEEAAPATGTEAAVTPTEAAASTMPLGANVGPAGLAAMPYTLTFMGNFFKIADFIAGLDELVRTKNQEVMVDGRLLTIDGFAVEEEPKYGFPRLKATFTVTSYLTPPSQGVTAGASPTSPAPETATPASTTLGG
jgi:Tfp pilus assembly protein PilO